MLVASLVPLCDRPMEERDDDEFERVEERLVGVAALEEDVGLLATVDDPIGLNEVDGRDGSAVGLASAEDAVVDRDEGLGVAVLAVRDGRAVTGFFAAADAVGVVAEAVEGEAVEVSTS